MAKVRVLSYTLVSLAFAGIVLFGCSDSGHGTFSQTEEQPAEQPQNDTEINILTSVFPSPKEQNPYSVENMNKTFKKLVLANNADARDIPELEANFFNAKHQGVCPTGWHIPSIADWDKFIRYVDGDNTTYSPYDSPTAGKYLKTTNGWSGNSSGNSNGEDKYGFSALPGGYGYINPEGFKNIGSNGDWWSTSEYDGTSAYRFDLYHGDKAGWEDVGGNRKHDKSNLFSVRCVKD